MLTSLDKLPDDAFVRWPAVRAVVPLCKSNAYQKIKQGEFPKPVPLGPRAVGWRVRDIRKYLANPTGWKLAASQVEG
jgi:prophage regulatory protein